MFLLLASIGLLILIYYFYLKIIKEPIDYFKSQKIPYINQWESIIPFILGLESIEDNALKVYRKYPNSKITGFFSLNRPTILVKDPDIIRQITIKDFDFFVNHSTEIFNEETDPILSKNLFQLKDTEWKKKRAIFSPAFTANKLRIVCDLMQECAEQLVNHYIELLKQQPSAEIKVELKSILLKYSVDIIASTVFGIQINSFKNPNNEFYKNAQQTRIFKSLVRFLLIPICPKIFKFFDIGLVPKKVNQFFNRICLDNIKQREEQNIYRPDALNLFLEEKRKNRDALTDEDIVTLSFSFFIVGLDTTTNLLCAVIFELAINPNCQKKLFEEIKAYMIDKNNQVTYELLKEMKYLDMVVLETSRKWPIASQTDRLCNKDYTLNVDGQEIFLKAGTNIGLPLFAIARDPKYFSNPDEFNPERFNSENKNKIHPATLLSFGIGPRQCIGVRYAHLETKVIVANIVKIFEILPIGIVETPIKLKKGSAEVVPEGGFVVKFKLRNSK